MYNPFSSYKSVTQWENSYFGGFTKVIMDYPYVSVPKQIATDVPEDNSVKLHWYDRQKLINIFLKKVSEKSSLIEHITEFAEKVKDEKTGKNYLVCKKSRVENVLNHISERESELGPLFDHYRNFITNTKIKFKLPDDDKDGEGSSNSGGKEIDKSKIYEAFADIKEYGTQYNNIGNWDNSQKKRINLTKKTDNDTKFNSVVRRNSERLVHMLDISFEPKPDRVTNLKAGKMDANKIAEIPAGNMNVHYTIQENVSTRPFSVCILVDESGSMSGNNIIRAKEILKTLWLTFRQLLPPEKIFIYGHSGQGAHSGPTDVWIQVYHDNYYPNFERTIDNMSAGGGNFDGIAIGMVHERVRKQTSDNIIFISISDGQPCGDEKGDIIRSAIERCKRDNFVTVGIGLGFNRIKECYKYFTVVLPENEDKMVANVSSLVNRVVKSEFQDS